MKKWTEKEYSEWLEQLKSNRYDDEDGSFNFSEDEWTLMDYIEELKKNQVSEEIKTFLHNVYTSGECEKVLNQMKFAKEKESFYDKLKRIVKQLNS